MSTTNKRRPTAKLSPREQWEQQNEEAREQLDELAASVTQREWLIITQRLDRTRQQIGADSGLTLCALGWVREKRDHGGASWDRLLDMTDAELEQLHGFAPGDGEDLATTPDDADNQAAEDDQAG